MKKELRYQPPQKSVGEQLMEDLMMIAIVSFLIYVICGIFKVIFYPVTWLFKTTKELDQEDLEKALQKKQAREWYLAEIRQDPNDPMNHYLDRFVNMPEAYADDPENDEYLKWYLNWRDGNVLDSRLRWAPDVYVQVDGKSTLNGEFDRYLEIQHELHLTAGWSAKFCFLQTIRKYFPEVTPKLSVMGADIEILKDRVKARELKAELAVELRKIGVPESVADALSKEKISGEEMLARAKVIKRCTERGYSQAEGIFIANQGYDPDGEKAAGAHVLLENGCPDFVAREYLEGKISAEDAKDIARFMKSMQDMYGDQIYKTGESGETLGTEAVKKRLAELKAKNRRAFINEKAGKAAWQA